MTWGRGFQRDTCAYSLPVQVRAGPAERRAQQRCQRAAWLVPRVSPLASSVHARWIVSLGKKGDAENLLETM